MVSDHQRQESGKEDRTVQVKQTPPGPFQTCYFTLVLMRYVHYSIIPVSLLPFSSLPSPSRPSSPSPLGL